MDDRFRKVSSMSVAEITPPILLRRRLSAPETIMRKHTLAQQRSSSQESDRSQNSETTQSCNWPLNASSDPNLTKKKDADIRKSTLMKRFWESSKNLQFPRTYSEWQYSFGKMKLGSNHSTPEHLRISRKNVFDTSPKHRRISPKHEKYDTNNPNKRKISIYNGNYNEAQKLSTESPRSLRKQFSTNGNYEEYDESYIIYSSNFSNVTSTDSAGNTSRTMEEPTTSTINSDSAFSNSSSSLAPISSDRTESNTNGETIKTYQLHSNSIKSIDNIPIPSLPIQYQFVIRENTQPDLSKSYEFIPKPESLQKSSIESATQTSATTNLNVITNVQLSKSTLNLIFNQVMQDVYQNKAAAPEPTPAKIINVQKMPSFIMTKKEELATQDARKKKISDVNVGSPYKNKPSSLVPRLSALPRSSSMEVNISSNESFDKESDSSLVDSLEDPKSPKEGRKHDDKVVRGELALLPDNSDNNKIIPTKKAAAFYIPIKNADDTTEEETKTKDVSTLLPTKLREKLLKRQMRREEKIKENTLKSFERVDVENGNVHPYFSTSPELPSNKSKSKRKKTTLPLIENKKDKHIEIEKDRSFRSSYTKRSLSKYRESLDSQSSTKSKSFWLPKSRQQNKNENLSPLINKTEKEIKQTRRYYQKSESCKQIEILEIMEIVEPERATHMTPKNKSRIPILVQHKLPKLPKEHKPSKPTYLDFDITENNSKLDQLIANILIDTLNREDLGDTQTFSSSEFELNSNKIQEFETIPEEHLNQNLENNNPRLIERAAKLITQQVLENNNLEQTFINPEPKLAENLDTKERLENSKIPKGWITFYMLQKNNSPDSTSDEGPKNMATKLSKSTQKSDYKSKKCKAKEKYSDYKSEYYFESDSESEPSTKQRKSRGDNKLKKGGWSVTVSGRANGDPGPDLEMRLKFPVVNEKIENKLNHQDIGTQKGSSQFFPPLSNKNQHQSESGFTFEKMCTNTRGTEINKSKQYLKNCESTSVHNSVTPARLNPRPTKTSRQRCMMNRSSNHSHYHDLIPPIEANRQLENIFGKFPDYLTINGNAVSRDNKSTLSNRGEQDLKRFLSNFDNSNIQ